MATDAASRKMSQLKLRTSSNRFALLLCSQFALIAIAPLASTAGHRPGPVFSVFALTLLVTAVYFVIEERHLRVIEFLLCAAAVLGGVLTSLGSERVFLIPGLICTISFMVFTTGVILGKVITAEKVTHETLYGAVSAYLFIGITCGLTYALIQLLVPGSIIKTVDTARPLVWSDFTFFSFTTLTSVGYGDMVPVGGVKSLAMLEAVIGAMYPPLMIGRLLTLLPGRGIRQ